MYYGTAWALPVVPEAVPSPGQREGRPQGDRRAANQVGEVGGRFSLKDGGFSAEGKTGSRPSQPSEQGHPASLPFSLEEGVGVQEVIKGGGSSV